MKMRIIATKESEQTGEKRQREDLFIIANKNTRRKTLGRCVDLVKNGVFLFHGQNLRRPRRRDFFMVLFMKFHSCGRLAQTQ
jgi:hypothetical protein